MKSQSSAHVMRSLWLVDGHIIANRCFFADVERFIPTFCYQIDSLHKRAGRHVDKNYSALVKKAQGEENAIAKKISAFGTHNVKAITNGKIHGKIKVGGSSSSSCLPSGSSDPKYRAVRGLSALQDLERTPTLFDRGPLSSKNRPRSQLVTIFDNSHHESWRQRHSSVYKSQRPVKREGFRQGLEIVQDDFFSNRGILHKIAPPGLEADDVLAKLAITHSALPGNETVIVSSDKDLYQLMNVNSKIKIFDPSQNVMLTRDSITEKFQIPPERLAEYLAICGDQVDNVPGIIGAGPKLAQKVLNHPLAVNKSLRQMYDHKLFHEMELAKRQLDLLVTGEQNALDSYEMVRLPPPRNLWTEEPLREIEGWNVWEDSRKAFFARDDKSFKKFCRQYGIDILAYRSDILLADSRPVSWKKSRAEKKTTQKPASVQQQLQASASSNATRTTVTIIGKNDAAIVGNSVINNTAKVGTTKTMQPSKPDRIGTIQTPKVGTINSMNTDLKSATLNANSDAGSSIIIGRSGKITAVNAQKSPSKKKKKKKASATAVAGIDAISSHDNLGTVASDVNVAKNDVEDSIISNNDSSKNTYQQEAITSVVAGPEVVANRIESDIKSAAYHPGILGSHADISSLPIDMISNPLLTFDLDFIDTWRPNPPYDDPYPPYDDEDRYDKAILSGRRDGSIKVSFFSSSDLEPFSMNPEEQEDWYKTTRVSIIEEEAGLVPKAESQAEETEIASDSAATPVDRATSLEADPSSEEAPRGIFSASEAKKIERSLRQLQKTRQDVIAEKKALLKKAADELRAAELEQEAAELELKKLEEATRKAAALKNKSSENTSEKTETSKKKSKKASSRPLESSETDYSSSLDRGFVQVRKLPLAKQKQKKKTATG